jgi:hypothetical protein
VSEDFSIQVDTRELDEFIDKLEEAPELVEKHMTAAMDGSLDLLLAWITDETPVNTGLLRSSFGKDITGTPANMFGEVVTPLVYGWPVEKGRKPGKMPPVDAIELWVKRKIGAGADSRQIAWAIARSIASKGTTGAFMVEQAYNRAKNGEEIAKIWVYQLEQFLKDLAK